MRAHEMIADLMLFARPPKLAIAAAICGRIVRQVVDEHRESAADRSIELECEVGAEPIAIQADATQLAVAIAAVVTNAIEAVGRDGHIHVFAREWAEAKRAIGGSDRSRRWARRSPEAVRKTSIRSVFQRPRGGARTGLRALEVLADRHGPRRPDRREQRRGRRGRVHDYVAAALGRQRRNAARHADSSASNQLDPLADGCADVLS